ncbi:hypothetical protein [Corallibacter sp.]|uniref:hypothetical protein n=1 Tax=Corallibacter sp. TaxID=2038084 RepID=UPI003AB1E4FB
MSYGWKVTVIYILSGIVIGVIGGIVLDKMGMSAHIAEWLKQLHSKTEKTIEDKRSLKQKFPEIHKEALSTLKKFTQSCCTGIVEYSLKKNVKGFIKAVSNTKKGQITVWYDSTKSTNKEVKEAINKTPYKVIKEIK